MRPARAGGRLHAARRVSNRAAASAMLAVSAAGMVVVVAFIVSPFGSKKSGVDWFSARMKAPPRAGLTTRSSDRTRTIRSTVRPRASKIRSAEKPTAGRGSGWVSHSRPRRRSTAPDGPLGVSFRRMPCAASSQAGWLHSPARSRTERGRSLAAPWSMKVSTPSHSASEARNAGAPNSQPLPSPAVMARISKAHGSYSSSACWMCTFIKICSCVKLTPCALLIVDC